MNFELTDDQLTFEDTARQFAQQELALNAAMWIENITSNRSNKKSR